MKVQCLSLLVVLLELHYLQCLRKPGATTAAPLVNATANMTRDQIYTMKTGQRVINVSDGCPMPWDLGDFKIFYRRPKLCQFLLPPDLVKLKPQSSNTPFAISLTPSGDDIYHYILITVEKWSNVSILGAYMNVQKARLGGGIDLRSVWGHLEGEPPWEKKGLCCTESKYETLIYFFPPKSPTNPRYTSLRARWFMMNFGVGELMIEATVFTEPNTYWAIRNALFKIPLETTKTTSKVED